jgi:hypothetical protein
MGYAGTTFIQTGRHTRVVYQKEIVMCDIKKILVTLLVAIVYAKGTMAGAIGYNFHPLPILSGQNINACEADAMSASSGTLIVGDCFNYVVPVGVYWDTQGNVNLLAPKDYNSYGYEIQPVAINNRGQIAGYYQTIFNGTYYPFFMNSVSDAHVTPIPPAVSGDWCQANGMNDFGAVVGTCFNPNRAHELGQAFLWTPSSGTVALQGLAHCTQSGATSIANDGTILGVSTNCNGYQTTKLWIIPPGGSAQQIVSACPGTGDFSSYSYAVFGPNGPGGGQCDAEAFMLTPSGVFTFLYPPNYGDETSVLGIANNGIGLGSKAGVPFIVTYASNGYIILDLNTLLGFGQGSPYNLNNAIATNGPGDIVGQANEPGVGSPAYYLTPQ